MSKAIGVDIGGTGIKVGLVDLETGQLLEPRVRVLTPEGRTPDKILDVIRDIIEKKKWSGPVGIGFPSIIRNGVCHSATNISDEWLGMNLVDFFSQGLDCDVNIANDADAAGLAEITFGKRDIKARKRIIFLTLGTGIGSSLISNNKLIPGTEFGLLKFKTGIAEHYASNKARERGSLSWKKWGKRLNAYLEHLVTIFSPDLIILGGGVSKKFEKYQDHLTPGVEVVPASLQNEAGVIGAALLTRSDQ